MGVTKLKGGGKTTEKKGSRLQALQKPEVVLPTAKTEPSTDIGDYNLYIYGLQKIGKTSLTAMFPDTLHFMLEPSGKAYSIYAVEPQSWMEFVSYIDALEKEKKAGTLRFKRFAIDTVDLLYQFCTDLKCSIQGIEHPNDANDFGKTWQAIESEFRSQIVRLASLGGIIALTHEVEKEIETRSGVAYTSIIPSAQKKCNLVLSKFCDMTGNYYIKGDGSRVLRITSHPDVEAGNRMGKDHFHYTDGTPIDEIPMGSSPEEAYKNLVDAFQNNLTKSVKKAEKSEPTSAGKKRPLKLKKGDQK